MPLATTPYPIIRRARRPKIEVQLPLTPDNRSVEREATEYAKREQEFQAESSKRVEEKVKSGQSRAILEDDGSGMPVLSGGGRTVGNDQGRMYAKNSRAKGKAAS